MAREREQIMLCYPFEEKRLDKWLKECEYVYIQPKYEGDRCRAVVGSSGRCTLFSSSAREINSVPHINKAIEELGVKDIELDGELYVHGMPHEEIRSRVSRTVGYHPDYQQIEYHVYDIVADYLQGTRLVHLAQILPTVWPEGYPIRLAPNYHATNTKGVESLYELCLNQGYEGIIFRHPKGKYVRKRSTEIMKLKPRLSGIYEIVDQQEEFTIQGEPKKALGALVLKDPNGSSFKIGTGFTRGQREDYWQLNLKGKWAKIRYQSITLEGGGVPKMASFESLVPSPQTETEV